MQGGCYCGAVRYELETKPVLKAQCHCRACQNFSGGAPNLFMAFPAGALRYVKGQPQQFRKDTPDAVATREFCATCGTQLASHRKGMDYVMVKVGTLDDPSLFGAPKLAIYTAEQQPFHSVPAGVASFAGLPELPKPS